MRHNRVFLAICMMTMVAIASILIVSCKKDNETRSEFTANEMTTTDDMNEYLISFKDKLLSSEKGKEFISLEQAQRDLGNLLNFDFGDVNHVTNTLHRDTIHLELAITQNQVDIYQLAHTYALAYGQVEKTFDLVNLPNKTVYSVYCIFNPMVKNGESVDVELIVTTRGFDETIVLRTEPSLYDCWTVSQGQGNCDGLFIGYDHVTVLESVYLRDMPHYGCTNNGIAYFSDLAQIQLYAYQYPETDTLIHYNIGYRLWAGYLWDYNNGQVEAEEMVYYYNNLRNIIDDEMDALNNDDYKVSAISCAIHQPTSLPDFYHFACKLEYGKIQCNGGNDE